MISRVASSWILGILLFSVAIGQLLRLEIFPGSTAGLTLVDVVTILTFLSLVGIGIAKGKLSEWVISIWSNSVWRWVLIFLGWALIALALQAGVYESKQILIAFSFWARLFLIFGVGMLLYGSGVLKDRVSVLKQFVFWSGLILLTGYVQFILVDNFAFMARFGWDPHIGRMLGSFFDPNFFGTYLVLFMSVLIGLSIGLQKNRWYVLLLILAWIALYLTFSRSAWLTGLIVLPLVAWPLSKKVSIAILLIFIIVTLLPTRLGERFKFGISIFNNDAFTSQTNQTSKNINNIITQGGDASGAARILTFRRGLDLFQNHWLSGVGYNAYGYALVREGLSDESNLESRAGYSSDSSLLNVLVTTGVIGFGLFTVFMMQAFRTLAKRWKQGRDRLALSLFYFTIGWLIGSFLNNTLFYVFILVPWIILMGTALTTESESNAG